MMEENNLNHCTINNILHLCWNGQLNGRFNNHRDYQFMPFFLSI